MVNNERKPKHANFEAPKSHFLTQNKESQHYGSLFKSWHNAVLLSKLKWEGIEHDKLFQLQRWLGATCHKQMHKWLAGDPSRRAPRMEHLYLQLCRRQPSRGWRSRARRRCRTPSSGAPAEPLPCYLAMQKTQTAQVLYEIESKFIRDYRTNLHLQNLHNLTGMLFLCRGGTCVWG